MTSQDKTPVVIRKAMAKHNLDGDRPEDYELIQIISEERGTEEDGPLDTLVYLCYFFIYCARYASLSSFRVQARCTQLGLKIRARLGATQNLYISFFLSPAPPSPVELKIPNNANVFYAMNSTANYDFVLKKRGFSKVIKIKHGSSSTLPRVKQKGLKIAKGIF